MRRTGITAPSDNVKAKKGTTRTVEVGGTRFDDGDDGPYPRDLYDFGAVAETIDGFGAVTDEQLDRYRELGYLAIDNAFSMKAVAEAEEALDKLIDGEPPDKSCVQFEKWAAERLGELSRDQKQDAVRKFENFTQKDRRLRAMAFDPGLTALIERITECRDIELMQEMALIKAPRGREKPWHQDRAYFNLAPTVPIVGVWIALHEATPQNGCMRVLPRLHRDGPVIHFQRRDWQICDTQIATPQAVAVPLRPGGLLIFDALVPHGTPVNQTSQRRWALQFHYCPKGAARTDDDQRLASFGSEGKDVEC